MKVRCLHFLCIFSDSPFFFFKVLKTDDSCPLLSLGAVSGLNHSSSISSYVTLRRGPGSSAAKVRRHDGMKLLPAKASLLCSRTGLYDPHSIAHACRPVEEACCCWQSGTDQVNFAPVGPSVNEKGRCLSITIKSKSLIDQNSRSLTFNACSVAVRFVCWPWKWT